MTCNPLRVPTEAGPGFPAAGVHPMRAFLAERGWSPFPFQAQTWAAYAEGRNGLLHAPTGMGKTYAVIGGAVREACAKLESPPAPLRVLWITPLRALAGDTTGAIAHLAERCGLPWTVESRTGDTPASVKTRQRRRLPSVLVTTPESLSLLLSYPETARGFGGLRLIVIDEWHELLGSKRGVQTELCLARLRGLAPTARTWGLSATLGNLEEAHSALLGSVERARAGVVIRGEQTKRIEVDVLMPERIERFPWAGHLGLRLLPAVIDALRTARSTLVFTNVRSQTERWFQALVAEAPPDLGPIGIHHGSLDRELRGNVEQHLREGKLRAVVCTSSLDLGVDFTPVEQVIQIGSPKGVARMMQRAGRSGHQPGAVSRLIGVPTNALELMEFAAARDAIGQGVVESRPPLEQSLDVLVQHLVTVALGGGFDPAAMEGEIRDTWAFRDLPETAWSWAIDFVTRGGPTLRAYPEFSKIIVKDGRAAVESTTIARRHRMSIGTITSDGAVRVAFTSGRTLGTIEESFITRLHPGDRFVFAGRTLELVRLRNMVAQVKPARSRRGVVPRWGGGRSPLSTKLAAALRAKLDDARRGIYADEESRRLRPLLALQAEWSVIPAADELLIEQASYRGGHHWFVFTFAGRLVNEGLAPLVAYRMTRTNPCSISTTGNDHGFELLAREPLELDERRWRELLSTDDLLDDLLGALNTSAMARRHFREIARVAGLVFPGFPGQSKSARQLQASSDLFFDVFTEFDPENRLLDQARNEVLGRELEFRRLEDALARVARERLTIVATERFTPLAFPLWADQMRSQTLSSETWRDRVERMVLRLEKAAEKRPRARAAR